MPGVLGRACRDFVGCGPICQRLEYRAQPRAHARVSGQREGLTDHRLRRRYRPGYATLGQIGFAERIDYTAIGTVCNLAARLCAEATNGQILISRRVAAAVEDTAALEEIGGLRSKGSVRQSPSTMSCDEPAPTGPLTQPDRECVLIEITAASASHPPAAPTTERDRSSSARPPRRAARSRSARNSRRSAQTASARAGSSGSGAASPRASLGSVSVSCRLYSSSMSGNPP